MTSEELTSLMRAVPFVPFALCTDSGDFHVPTLDHVAHVPGTPTAAVVTADGTIEVVDLAAAYAETLAELRGRTPPTSPSARRPCRKWRSAGRSPGNRSRPSGVLNPNPGPGFFPQIGCIIDGNVA